MSQGYASHRAITVLFSHYSGNGLGSGLFADGLFGEGFGGEGGEGHGIGHRSSLVAS